MLTSRIDLTDCIDTHMHTAPSIYERALDDKEAALQAREAGMKAIMIKCHYESTVSRAYHTMKSVPGIKVYGGIVLNNFVGGLNPSIVDTVLKQGGKEIWMPTTDSAQHEKTFGIGSYGLSSMKNESKIKKSSITILNEDKELNEKIKEIIELVSEYEAIIGTSHLSNLEMLKLTEYCQNNKAKVLITHPLFIVNDLEKDFLKKLVDMGAMAEFLAATYFNLPTDHRRELKEVKAYIDYIGPEQTILASDAGQPFNPLPVEALRVFAESLYEMGVSKKDLKIMMKENPSWLLS